MHVWSLMSVKPDARVVQVRVTNRQALVHHSLKQESVVSSNEWAGPPHHSLLVRWEFERNDTTASVMHSSAQLSSQAAQWTGTPRVT